MNKEVLEANAWGTVTIDDVDYSVRALCMRSEGIMLPPKAHVLVNLLRRKKKAYLDIQNEKEELSRLIRGIENGKKVIKDLQEIEQEYDEMISEYGSKEILKSFADLK